MKELAEAGKISVGVKFDQPGLGFKGAADDVPTGFDIEIAKILVANLGIDPESDKVTWIETISDNREPFLQQDKVDLVLATYSITDERRQVVGQAGPYIVTGQQLLVKNDSDVKSMADLKGKEVCSVTGLDLARERQGRGHEAGAASTPTRSAWRRCWTAPSRRCRPTAAILLGYAAQNEGELKVVGEEFSEERIGVGYSKDRPEMCEWITDTIKKAMDDGNWEKAFKATLGKSGEEAPEPPAMDPCQS